MPATEPAPEAANCNLRNNRFTSRGSSPTRSGSRERRMDVRPGAKKHSPSPVIPSSVSIRTNVQSKFPSTTAVLRRTIFKSPTLDGSGYTISQNGLRVQARFVIDPTTRLLCWFWDPWIQQCQLHAELPRGRGQRVRTDNIVIGRDRTIHRLIRDLEDSAKSSAKGH